MKNQYKYVKFLMPLLLCILLLTTASPTTGMSGHAIARQSTTVTLIAVADAMIENWEPDANFGSALTLKANYNVEGNKFTLFLVRFDVSSIPNNAIIDSARLELYMDNSGGPDPITLGIYPINNAWSESTVTWNTAPPAAATGLNWQVNSTVGYKTRSGLGSFVYTWMAGSSDGVMIYGPINGYYWRRFSSRERGSNRPRLVVTYHVPSTVYMPVIFRK